MWTFDVKQGRSTGASSLLFLCRSPAFDPGHIASESATKIDGGFRRRSIRVSDIQLRGFPDHYHSLLVTAQQPRPTETANSGNFMPPPQALGGHQEPQESLWSHAASNATNGAMSPQMATVAFLGLLPGEGPANDKMKRVSER
jgi:hypothetical protein